MKRLSTIGLAAILTALPLSLAACNTRTEKSKTTEKTVKDTPEGTKVTTETTERKVETTPKNP